MYKLPAYVGIILKKDNQALMVKRHNTDWAQGFWNFPGGLVEKNETLLQAAIRETQEEVGVVVNPEDFKLVHVLYVIKNDTNTKDIIGFYFMAESWCGEAVNAEPHRHSEIGWFDINRLPSNSTKHALQAINGLLTNTFYSENGIK